MSAKKIIKKLIEKRIKKKYIDHPVALAACVWQKNNKKYKNTKFLAPGRSHNPMSGNRTSSQLPKRVPKTEPCQDDWVWIG